MKPAGDKTGAAKGKGGAKPPKSSSSGSSSGAATPSWQDYLSLIQNDPIYHQTVADENAASAADASSLGSGILSALVNRGMVPDIASAASALGLSPAVVNWIKSNVNLSQAQSLASAANASGTSLEAQLDQAHKTNLGNISDSLAARGMLSSGATPFLDGQEATRDTKDRYDADKALADYISGAYSSFAKNEQGRTGDLRTALTDAYSRVLASLGGAAPPHSGGAGGGAAAGSGGIPSAPGFYTRPPEKTVGSDLVLHGMRPTAFRHIGPHIAAAAHGMTNL